MPANSITILPKKKILEMAKLRCRHGHSYLSHPACWISEGRPRRTGFLDIETSNLSADFGILFSYCILDDQTGEIYSGVLKPSDLKPRAGREEDYRLVKQAISDMRRFDHIVGFYSSRFDIPFLRTRAVINGLEFVNFGEITHEDIYFTVKRKFRLARNRQETACRALLGKTEKTHINATYWRRALAGDRKSLEYILDHNRRDVRDLQRLYRAVRNYFGYREVSL